MARTDRYAYTAVERWERRATRRTRPTQRRTGTRQAALAVAIREG